MAMTRAKSKQITHKLDATGAATVNLHSKLSETVSVLDFGAVGDGVTDDTAAIQAAIDACKNGTVFFPVGSYKVTDTLKIEYDTATGIVSTNLVGEGLGSLILWSGPNSIPVFWYEATSNLQGFFSKTRIENLHFINSGSAIDSIGIKLGNLGGPLGMNSGIQNFTVKGCKLTSFDYCVWTEYESDTILIQDNVFQSYKKRALYLPGSADVTVSDNYFQAGAANSLAIYGETASYAITGNLIQSSNFVQGAVLLLKSGGFVIDGNYIEFPLGNDYAISIQQTRSGSIANNNFHGMQGIDVISIDSASWDINIGVNFYGFFGYPIRSFVKAYSGARGISVLGNQNYETPVTISNGSPAIVTSVANAPGWQVNQRVYFTTTGVLPTGLSQFTEYYIVNPSGITFEVSATPSGAAIATSSAGSGTHTCHILLATPFDGDSNAFDFSFDNNYLRYGVPNYTGTPNPGVTIARSGVLNIGNSGQASGWGFLTFNRSGVAIGAIQQSGTTGVVYNTTSDYRLKEDVQPMTGALAKVAALKPVTYKWKADGSNGEGFIAHELADVCPQAVTGEKDAMSLDGKPVYQGIDTSLLVATLTAAIQELKAEFDAYKASHP